MKRTLLTIALVVVGVGGAWAPAGAIARTQPASGPGTAAPAGTDGYRQFLSQARNRVNRNEATLGTRNVATLTPAWTVSTGTANPFAAPVVDGHLLIEGEYQCCPSPSRIEGLDRATGAIVWSTPTPAPIVATAAVTGAGVVFAGDYDGTLYALDGSTGTILWTGDGGSQFFDPNDIAISHGVVYTTTRNGPLSAWSAAGCGATTCQPLWMGDTAGASSGPAVGDGTVFVPSHTGDLDAFPAHGCGKAICEPSWAGIGLTAGADFGSVAVAGNFAYAGNQYSPYVYVYRTAGCRASLCNARWSYPVGGGGIGPGAIAIAGGRAIVGGSDGIDSFATGCPAGRVCQAIWRNTSYPNAKIIVANGVVYAAASTSLVAADAAGGKALWTSTLTAPYGEGPTVADGMLFVADTFGHRLEAFGLPVG